VDKKHENFGCIVCEAAGVQNAYARYEIGKFNLGPRASFFRRHEQSKGHISAVTKLLGEPSNCAESGAPSTRSFMQVLDATRKGQGRAASGVAGVGKRMKIRRMKYALAESTREVCRSFLKRCSSIGIMQDVRRQRLLVRYQAATSTLETRRGILGQIKIRDGHAEALRDATLLIFERFCEGRLWVESALKGGETTCRT
jgi:hypothetical protein